MRLDAFLVAWLALMAPDDRLRVAVSPTVMLAGHAVRVTCHLPKDATNRWLRFGVEGWTDSLRQVDGEDAPLTWTLDLSHVPCGVEQAFCEVTRTTCAERVTTRLAVAGCNE